MKILIGADPEFFLCKAGTKEYVSAHPFIPGSKKEPHKLQDGACQLDGTAIEFNINPAGSSLEFEYNVHSVLRQIRGMIPKEYDFAFVPAVNYSKKEWDGIPESSKELGCDPDFNAHNQHNKPQDPPKPSGTMRTGAGHLHLGWTDKADPTDEVHFWDCRTVVNDLATLYSNTRTIWDQDQKRAMMYGNGPVFRPKPYGVEFRTPSNAWLNYPKLWSWIFESTKEVFFRTNNSTRTLGYDLYIYEYAYPTPESKFKVYNSLAKKLKLPPIPDNWNEKAA